LPGLRLASRSNPSTPASTKRRCQRHTAGRPIRAQLAPTHVRALSALPGVLERSKIVFGKSTSGEFWFSAPPGGSRALTNEGWLARVPPEISPRDQDRDPHAKREDLPICSREPGL
jgi:hypothetical protein